MGKTVTDEQTPVDFDCSNCPAYCCSIYERVEVTKRDLKRLAKHFGLPVEVTEKRHTKIDRFSGDRVLRRKKDVIFDLACGFLDPETRGCTIYHARPAVCRSYPVHTRCTYYDLIQFERAQQGDPGAVPLVQITFREVEKKAVR